MEFSFRKNANVGGKTAAAKRVSECNSAFIDRN
jgi:hypothetical protein